MMAASTAEVTTKRSFLEVWVITLGILAGLSTLIFGIQVLTARTTTE